LSNYGPNENLTLTLQEIESYQNQGSGKVSGKYIRYYCPIHGGDNQRSLSLDPETGRFKCFTCGAWGYLAEKRQEWLQENRSGSSWNIAGSTDGYHNPTPSSQIVFPPFPSATIDEPPVRPDLVEPLQKFQEALPGSPGEEYLKKRGIPLEVARKHGLGYAAPGLWPNLKKYFHFGCIGFPHTNPAGEVVNLYGRAVDIDIPAPKKYRHAHLEGAKGVFNAQALAKEKVFITEGPFDALSLLAAGYEACAIFGVNGLRWPWVKARVVVFGFDQDEAGDGWKDLAYQGTLLGMEVYFLPKETYANYKDLSEAWAATERLDIGEWMETRPEKSIDVCYGPRNEPDLEPRDSTVPTTDVQGMAEIWDQMMEGNLKEPVPVAVLSKFQGMLGSLVWFLPDGAPTDTGRSELSFYREELIKIVPLLIESPEYAEVLIAAKQTLGGVLIDENGEVETEESELNQTTDADQEHQVTQQDDRPAEINNTQGHELIHEGVHLVRIEHVSAHIKIFEGYAGPRVRLEMKIIEGPDAGKTLVDNIALPHPHEPEGRQKRRLRILLRLNLISRGEKGNRRIKWKEIEGTCFMVDVVHNKFKGRQYAMVENYQPHSTSQAAD
jgi:hypothetical protein